ncbi:TPA: glycosyltransferase family 1 protein, partial [Mannheimia haemolytica]|nr:glycosyltransferase family 1 protein [Mannheimia haemolytica]
HLIREGVNFNEIVKLYKKFKVFLNVNTITQSTTMMSRRVYELLASGTPVVSTPSKAITAQFPGIVITVNNEKEAELAVHKLLTDSYYWHKQSMLGIREVMSKHTYENRWEFACSVINNEPIKEKTPSVRIIAVYHNYL